MNGQQRPTARQAGRFDVSPTAPRASGAAASTEASLFRAYGNLAAGQVGMFRVGPRADCACGGTIVVGESVEGAVAEHNGTPRHQAWRAWRES